jgi:hypothetical protein
MFLVESEKNSLNALRRALDEGFGIETDLRDLNGTIVISHDPPTDNPYPPTLDCLLSELSTSSYSGLVALNIKADGLCKSIQNSIFHSRSKPNQFFVFDMSFPDTISYMKSSIPSYLRISEFERLPVMPDKPSGVWVDNFSGSFPQVEQAKALIDQGIRTTIVSPELHQREHVRLWDHIVESGIHLSPLFQLCTDFPMQAAKKFIGA